MKTEPTIIDELELAPWPDAPDIGPRAGRNRLRGARVLLAEDHPINQEIASEVLGRAGACVTVAGNGEEAVQAVLQAVHPFDVVLMDIQMPVLDGFQATSRIRESHSRHALPIIAMTANALSNERERCISAGMNDHIAKPIDLVELFLVLNRWIRREGVAGGGYAGEELLRERPLPDRLPGLDIAAGMRRVGGNGPLFVKLLAAFRTEHQGAVAGIRQALAGGHPEQGAALLHALTGLAGNLGADGVCAVLAELEIAVRNGSPEAVEPALVALDKELQLLFQSAQILEAAELPRQKGEARGAPEELSSLFLRLSGLLSCNNMQAVQLFERLSPLLEPSEELAKLKSELDRLDFKSALLTLELVAKQSL
jgi:two-component system, sensor histidine kinase and response regulator